MAAKIHCPKLKELSDQLEPLVGRATTVTLNKTPNKFQETSLAARYVGRDGKIAAVCQFDLELAACLGAALAMVPISAAQDDVKAGKLSPNLSDAFNEVANILAGVLCVDGAPHVRWTDVSVGLAAIPADVKAVVAKPVERIDVQVAVEGYGGGGGGCLSVLTAKVA
ncbi:hypothetical protein K2X89_07065 [Myxococcota bacterium]|nr:hypothetical protein [Myxococcota bacterium]